MTKFVTVTLSDGVLTYNFENGLTDTAEEYSNVSKCNRLIESYTRNPRTREVTEAFPNAYDPEYSWYRAYDVYGKLINVVGAFTNKYDVAPECRQGDACTTGIDNASSKLASSKDLVTGKETKYAYKKGRVSKIGVFDSTDNMIEEETYTYDNKGRLLKDDYIFDKNGNKSVSSEIEYYIPNEDDPAADNTVVKYVYKVNNANVVQTQNTCDVLKRIETKNVSIGSSTEQINKKFTYGRTRVKEVKDELNGENLGSTEYDHDPYGRIKKIIYVSNTTPLCHNSYEYDAFGQLIRENNEALDKTYVYEYNSIGNITKVKNYHYRLIDPLTNCSTDTEYTYDTTHPDRLIAVDGNSITYNSLGCVQTYKGKRYDWERGRLVKVRQGNKNAAEGAYEECTFTYDGYGRRMQKSYLTGYNYPAEDAAYNSSTTNTIDYTYDNSGRLIRELRTNVIQYGTTTTTTRELIYLYDESGMIGVMHSYNGETPQSYYYHRNLQGDVIAIYDANGEKQVEYAYDAWGNCEIVYGENSNLASLNPIRYRGYYYDTETGLYYLNARYYSPEWRRFISPDAAEYIDPETPNGLNLYAYCNNDPVNYVDPSGHSAFLVAMSILAVAGLITTGIGLATDNNLVTAIGLTAVAVPALISGGLAISLLTPVGLVIGITTTVTGAGTALFASAEYQEAFTHNNWMLDAGMSEGWYKGLMLTTAIFATLGTMASSVAYSLNMNTITEWGRIKGVRAKDGYPGIRFTDKSGAIRSLEFHPAHHEHGVHLQLNNWWLNKQGYVGQYYRAFSKHFEIFKFWKGWF